MRIGFIGPGRVGCSLGAYFSKASELVGYCGRTAVQVEQAATLTGSAVYSDASALAADVDVLFFTVSDGAVGSVWKSLTEMEGAAEALTGTVVAHCSGALSSSIFSGAAALGAHPLSLHPLFAFASKQVPTSELSQAFFTLEGDAEGVHVASTLLDALGNPYQQIAAESKTRYHAAAALASNHVVALFRIASEELVKCGFTLEAAERALAPLFVHNAQHIAHVGTIQALTGPAERGDQATICKHLDTLDGDARDVYKLLTKTLYRLSNEKHAKE